MGKKKKLKKRIKCLSKNLNFILKDMIVVSNNVDFCQQQIDVVSETLLARIEEANKDTKPTIIVKENSISSIDKALFEQRVLRVVAEALSR